MAPLDIPSVSVLPTTTEPTKPAQVDHVYPALIGHYRACEEYAYLGQDFCRWASRPHRLSVHPITLDTEFLASVQREHEWRAVHGLALLGVILYITILYKLMWRRGSRGERSGEIGIRMGRATRGEPVSRFGRNVEEKK